MSAKPNEIAITRVYDAPVKLVWEAWTDLKKLEKWWGPRGFTITTKSKEMSPGGKWIYTMHGPDGTDYPNIATYYEVVPFEKLVYDHGATETTPPLFRVSVTFREEKGKTIMHMISTLPTAEQAKAMKGFIRQAGGNSTWDRLGEFMERESVGSDPFLFNRTVEGNVNEVFELLVNPDRWIKWMRPLDSKMKFDRVDVKEGGSALWSMSNSNGDSKHGVLHYKKIDRPKTFAYLQHFSDINGRLQKPFFSSDYPDQLLTTFTLAEEGTNETRVTVRWDIYGEATETEREVFQKMKPVMTEGWNQSFDKIDTMLVQR